MIDTHCHLNLDPLYQDWSQVVASAQKAGVTKVLVPGVDLDTSQKAIQLASQSKNIHAMAGLHPHTAENILKTGSDPQNQLEQFQQSLEDLVKKNKFIAIGECGLDHFRIKDRIEETKTLQQQLFIFQLELSRSLKLPVSIHIRDAHDDALALLTAHRPRGVLHCFSGNHQYLTKSLDLGLYVSFAGNIAFKNSQSLQSLAQKTPLDRLLIETDAPFLNPNRGVWPNTPANITKTYQVISDLKKVPLPKLTQTIASNVKELFGI